MPHSHVIRNPEGGGRIIHILRRGPKCCEFCDAKAGFQCDYEIAPGKTCDKHICLKHAKRVRAGKDYCPDHARP